jgi:hypothetical protein
MSLLEQNERKRKGERTNKDEERIKKERRKGIRKGRSNVRTERRNVSFLEHAEPESVIIYGVECVVSLVTFSIFL